MGTVSFNYKVLEYTPVQGYHMVEKHVENQPTLKTIFADGNGQLFDGKFTTMEGSSYTYPYTGYAGTYGNSVIKFTESTVEGIKTSLFGKGIGNGFKYFENNNTEQNKFIEKIPLPLDTNDYPIDVFETDNTRITVLSVVKNSATGYTGYVSGEYNGTLYFRKEYTSEDLNNLINKLNVRVYDKTLNTYFDKEVFCLDAAGTVARFGDRTANLIISGLFLEDYNPKYVCHNVTNSNYVTDLTDNNDMLQYSNEEIGYDSSPGTISCITLTYQSDRYSYNNGYDEFFSEATIDGNSPEKLYNLMYDNTSDFKLDETKSEWPGVQKYVDYLNAGADITDPDWPIPNCKYAYETRYEFNISYIDLAQLELNAKLDNGKYHIGNCIANYAVPEPQPELPDPEPVEDYTPEWNPYNEPENPQDNPPSPEPEVDNTVLDDINGLINGRDNDNNYQDEEQTGSDGNPAYITDTDLVNVSWVGSNWSIYFGNIDTIAKLRDDLTQIIGSGFDKAALALDDNYNVTDVIYKVIQLPFKYTSIMQWLEDTYGAARGWEQAVPCYNNTPLCSELAWVGSFDNWKAVTAARFVRANGDINDGQQTTSVLQTIFNLLTPGLQTMKLKTRFLPITKTANTYPRILNRLVPINYGTITIKRIFGNYLDFTEVNYIIELPTGLIVNLDNQLLWRSSGNGSELDECELKIDGYLDMESGDVLVTIYANGDKIHQTTINIAFERTLYGKDDMEALRNIVKGLFGVTKGIARLSALPSNFSRSSANTSTTESYDVTSGITKNTDYFNKRYDSTHNAESAKYSANGAIGDVLQGNHYLAQLWSGSPNVQMAQAEITGAVKGVANQLPVLRYDYPEIITPRESYSGVVGSWDSDFKYEEEFGLPACTTKIGRGFNQFSNITYMKSEWCYNYKVTELAALKKSLLSGFYIYSLDNCYIEPKLAFESLFWDNRDSSHRKSFVSESFPNRVILRNVSNYYRRYIDRYIIARNNINIYQGITEDYISDCVVLDDQDIEHPVLKISSEIWNYQNEVAWYGRIYNIVKYEQNIGHYVTLYLEEDYITTWFYFFIIKGLITRSTSYYINDLADNLPKTVRRIVKTKIFDNLKNDIGVTLCAASACPYKTKAMLDSDPEWVGITTIQHDPDWSPT